MKLKVVLIILLFGVAVSGCVDENGNYVGNQISEKNSDSDSE